MSFIIATTRFNNETFMENKRWRETNLGLGGGGVGGGCIYKVPIKIASSITVGIGMYIIEMNNSTNKIEGIGVICNQLRYDCSEMIYSDRNYNRYTYRGVKRVDREDILAADGGEEFLREMESVLFKGKGHMKRGQSITRLPVKKTLPKYVKFISGLVGG